MERYEGGETMSSGNFFTNLKNSSELHYITLLHYNVANARIEVLRGEENREERKTARTGTPFSLCNPDLG